MHFLPTNPLNALQNIFTLNAAVTQLDDLQKRVQTLIKLTFPAFYPVKSPEKIKNPIVKELTDTEKKDLIRITKIWHSQAKSKGDEYARAKFQSEIVYDNPFFHSFYINMDIKSALKKENKYPDDSPPSRVFACFDGNDIQAIAIANKSTNKSLPPYLFITYLATHPKNIRSFLNNEESNRVSGAASAIISHLVEVCQKEKMESIRLISVKPAVGFYQKIGFKHEEPDSSRMVLNATKGQE